MTWILAGLNRGCSNALVDRQLGLFPSQVDAKHGPALKGIFIDDGVQLSSHLCDEGKLDQTIEVTQPTNQIAKAS
jgi:hypothetical protein